MTTNEQIDEFIKAYRLHLRRIRTAIILLQIKFDGLSYVERSDGYYDFEKQLDRYRVSRRSTHEAIVNTFKTRT